MNESPPPAIGFIGLGSMGEPMALNLLRAGTPLVVWNRTAGKAQALAAAGAEVAASAAEVFERTRTVIVMLIDSAAIDAVLSRGSPAFAKRIKGRTLVHMGTTSPRYSQALAADVHSAGGRYVEAPVSGSRKPAETGELLAMLAGDADVVAAIRPLLGPLCHEVIVCGPVPNALSMKLGSNLFASAMLTGMAEAMNYARFQGLDLDQFVSVLVSGPLSSDLLRMKAPKIVARDFSVQASIATLLDSHRLIAETARATGVALPLLETSRLLYEEAARSGLGEADVTAVLQAYEARSGRAE